MARTPRRSPLRPLERGYLYIAERQAAAGLSDAQLAQRLGVSRQTIFRWKKEQWRVTADNMEKLATVLGCEPRDLFRPPAFESVDAIIEGLADHMRQMVVDIAKTVAKKRPD
jgi:transcriptional regulator with XRE-family HTH domain